MQQITKLPEHGLRFGFTAVDNSDLITVLSNVLIPFIDTRKSEHPDASFRVSIVIEEKSK